MDLEAAAAAVIRAAETQPPHAYWHVLPDERRALGRDPARAATRLAPGLGHASAHVRRFVARLLRELHQPAVLRRALADADEEVRYEACLGVLGIPIRGDRAYAPPLEVEPALHGELLASLRSFTGAKPYMTHDLLPLRVRLGDPELLAFTRTHAADARWSEIYNALAHIPGGGARVVELTRDPVPDVRQRACVALYQPFVDLDPAQAITALVERLADPETRSIAAIELRHLDARHVEPELLALLPDRGAIETLARWQSQTALPRILVLARAGDSTATDALLHYPGSAAIEDTLLAVLAGDADVTVKHRAAEVLSRQGSSSSVPALEQFVARDARALIKRDRKDVQKRLPVRIAQLRERPPWPR